MIAFDANVFIYSMDDADPVKHLKALDLLAQHVNPATAPQLLWQVACETLAWLRRRELEGRLSREDVEAAIRRLVAAYPLVVPTPQVLEFAVELTNRYSISHWDSLLLAACIDANIDTLYSEDMSHNMTYDSVTVLNPFKN